MPEQVGVAADGRGEVGIAQKVQAEVPEVRRVVHGLSLRAQDHLIDELGIGLVLGTRDYVRKVLQLYYQYKAQVQGKAQDGGPSTAQSSEQM